MVWTANYANDFLDIKGNKSKVSFCEACNHAISSLCE